MSKQAMLDEAGEKKPSAKCYNCGAEDHFMMACPEPTRQVPAGLAAARAAQTAQVPEVKDNLQHPGCDQRPYKRPKTMPIVTRFPPPRNGPIITSNPSQAGQQLPLANQGRYAGSTQQYQQLSGTMPYGQSYSQDISPQFNMSYVQYGPQQPCGQPLYQGYSQPSLSLPQHHMTAPQQHSYQPSQNASYQYQGYPTSLELYGYDVPAQYSNQSLPGQPLPQYPPYHQSPSPSYQEPVQHWGHQPIHPSSQAGPASQTTRRAYQSRHHNYPKSRHHQQAHHSHQRRSTRPSSSSANAPNFQRNPSPHSNEDQDFEWDLEKSFVEIVHPEVHSVAQPLPAVFNDEPIIFSNNTSGVTLKYVRPINLEVFCLDIRKTLHWPMLEADPVFKDIDYDSELVPLDKVDEWLQNRPYRNKVTDIMGFERGSHTHRSKRALSDEVVDRNRHVNLGSSSAFPLERCRQSLETHRTSLGNHFTSTFDGPSTPVYARRSTPSLGAEDDVWAPQPGEGLSTNSPTRDPTEVRLAALGVTGSPKPLSKRQSKPYFGTLASYEEELSSCNRKLGRQDSGYVSARGSYSNPSANGPEIFSTRRQSYSANNPPPPPPLPPPPPAHLRRQVDGQLEIPQSNGPSPGHAPSIVPHNGRHQVKPPLTPTPTDILANENRALHERSNGRKTETPRQIDDVITRTKNNQPKVAEAYNRRW